MEGLRARVERRASRGVWFGYRTGQGYALKVEAPIQRRRAHLARADELVHGKGGSSAKGARCPAGARPSRRLQRKGWDASGVGASERALG